MSIEFWSIDADKLCLAAYGDTACATHTCTIDHDGIERNDGWNLVLLCEEAHELHHDGRADTYYLIDLLALDHLLDTCCHQTLLAV